METFFLEDPSYEIREKEMEKIHEVLSRNRVYEAKAIFLKKMVYALIDATKIVPKTDFSIPDSHKIPIKDIEHEHLEFPKAKLQIVAPEAPHMTQVREISHGPPIIPRSPILLDKIQQKISQRQTPLVAVAQPQQQKIQVTPRPQAMQQRAEVMQRPQVQIKPQVSIEPKRKPTLEEGIPIPSPPKGLLRAQGVGSQIKQEADHIKEAKIDFPAPPTQISTLVTPPHRFDTQELISKSPKLEGVMPLRREEQKIQPPKPRVEPKTKEITKTAIPQAKYEEISIESLPDIEDEEEILKIKGIPEQEQKYMPPQQYRQEPSVDIKELEPEAQKPKIQPEIPQIQPTVMKVADTSIRPVFEIEHHEPEQEYKELEPVERRFIPLHQEIELAATPIQRKAQSIMPPPPKPTGGQVARDSGGSGVSFLDINPRSGVREVEGNILYEVADPFSLPIQEVFEFIRLSVFVNPNKINDSKFLEESFKKISKQLNVTIQDKNKKEIISKVIEYINGFGKIRDMLGDPSVSAIYCSGLNRPISVDFKLIGKISTNVVYVDKLELERLIKNMARMAGKTISESNPILDATIPPNIKVEATLGGDFISSKFVIKKF